jgi:hypothetical protein
MDAQRECEGEKGKTSYTPQKNFLDIFCTIVLFWVNVENRSTNIRITDPYLSFSISSLDLPKVFVLNKFYFYFHSLAAKL